METSRADWVGWTGSSVRGWKAGRVTWPKAATRKALEEVTCLPAAALGFIPRGITRGLATEEDPLRRRAFIASAGATAVSAAAPTTVGASDVQRLRDRLTDLWLMDDQEGGASDLESRALALRDAAVDLQQKGHATQRVRSRLYALTAAAAATTTWAALDARAPERAQRHVDTTITLAGLSGDAQVQHQAWRYASMLAEQRERPVDAVAAAEAAMGTPAHRRDPLYASIGHAMLAVALANTHNSSDVTRARRALQRATDAYDRADHHQPRPASMAFYTRGELEGLTAITLSRLGMSEHAEYHLHRCLAALRPDQRRNRGLYTASLALAQLDQGDPEQACATAASVASPATGRVHHLVADSFTRKLAVTAPGAKVTREWTEYARTL